MKTRINIKCPNCKGKGGFEIAVECFAEDVMWVSDGVCMELGYKNCFWCDGTGKISESRIKEVKKIKQVEKF